MCATQTQESATQVTEMRVLRCIADKRRVDWVRSDRIREEPEKGEVLGKVRRSQL